MIEELYRENTTEDNHRVPMDLDKFTHAFTEYQDSIIKEIDEMKDNYKQHMSLLKAEGKAFHSLSNKIEALTELRTKILEMK